MINLNGATRKTLLDFLVQLDILQTEDGCRYVLKNAGLELLIPRIKFGGPLRLVIGNLVDFLAAWGTIEGQEALILFLFALLDEVGGDGQRFLQSFIDELQGKQRTMPNIPNVRAPTPPEELPEKLIGEPTLLPLSYLEQALNLARAVAYIETSMDLGTGFLVSPTLLITNHHVIPDKASSNHAVFRFNYQLNLQGNIGPIVDYSILEGGLFYTNSELDYTLVELSNSPGEKWGIIPIQLHLGVQRNDRVNIIQHPGGRPKQISFRNNFIEYVDDRVLQYVTHTEPGSSGSPVFSDRWELVAVHHAGGVIREPGSQLHFYRNEGIAIQAIVETLPNVVRNAIKIG